MEKFEAKLNKERELYRELFINSEKTFKELLKKLKSSFSCNKCNTCCKIRYSQLPPEEIFKLATDKNDEIAKCYMQLFLPYGAQEEFKYSRVSKIDVDYNNKQAKNVDDNKYEPYVAKILLKHENPVYFYYCKYLNSKNICASKDKRSFCKGFPNSISTILPESCSFKDWQKLVLNKIENEIEPEINLKTKEILDCKNRFKCARTGTCCKLASSEFSYEQLKQKAANNDNYARQFTEIFIPYKNFREARNIFPEYVDFLTQKTEKNKTINFYYCKHLTGENVCPIYEARPQICRDFPDNPLALFPPTCSYNAWKEETIVAAYILHTMTLIYDFYKEKINNSL